MMKLLKNLFSKYSTHAPEWPNDSIQHLVNVHAINKRKNVRIQYPYSGACGPLPAVFHSGQELTVGNISVGGLLIFDQHNILGAKAGETLVLELRWSDGLSVRLRSRIVSIHLDRRHIQFVDFNAPAFLKISALTRPGYHGSRFHKVADERKIVDAEELWIGPSHDTLVFLKAPHGHSAELQLGPVKWLFYKNNLQGDNQQHPTQSQLEEILVILCNISKSQGRIQTLIDLVINLLDNYPHQSKTG
jgi:hypothetical protein